jgi:hypothetical protein
VSWARDVLASDAGTWTTVEHIVACTWLRLPFSQRTGLSLLRACTLHPTSIVICRADRQRFDVDAQPVAIPRWKDADRSMHYSSKQIHSHSQIKELRLLRRETRLTPRTNSRAAALLTVNRRQCCRSF